MNNDAKLLLKSNEPPAAMNCRQILAFRSFPDGICFSAINARVQYFGKTGMLQFGERQCFSNVFVSEGGIIRGEDADNNVRIRVTSRIEWIRAVAVRTCSTV